MRSIFILALAGLLLVGCHNQTERESPTSTTLRPVDGPIKVREAAKPVGLGAVFDTDDCAARMHTLSGQLIFFYARHSRLPVNLDELRADADPGEDTPTVCPVSKQPYIYNANGLVSGDSANRLIAYDATPAHSGVRWGVLFLPGAGRKLPSTDVVQIPEAGMASYRPGPPLPGTFQQQSQAQTQPGGVESIDQLSPALREKVLEQQRQLRREIDQRRQPMQDGPGGANPQQQPQQPIQNPQQQNGNPQQ